MRTSNRHSLPYVLAPLGGYNEVREWEEYEYKHIDESTDEGLRELVTLAILPHFKRFDPASQQIIKDTLCYALHDETFNFRSSWDSIDPPFDLGARSKRFFAIMWEVFFPDSPLGDCCPEGIVDVDNLNAAADNIKFAPPSG